MRYKTAIRRIGDALANYRGSLRMKSATDHVNLQQGLILRRRSRLPPTPGSNAHIKYHVLYYRSCYTHGGFSPFLLHKIDHPHKLFAFSTETKLVNVENIFNGIIFTIICNVLFRNKRISKIIDYRL